MLWPLIYEIKLMLEVIWKHIFKAFKSNFEINQRFTSMQNLSYCPTTPYAYDTRDLNWSLKNWIEFMEAPKECKELSASEVWKNVVHFGFFYW